MAGGHGGRRPGAGRKPGSRVTKTQLLAAEVREDGVSPLEVQLRTMRALWAEATDSAGAVIDFGKASAACSIARDCASYLHPRLAAVMMNPTPEVVGMTAAELRQQALQELDDAFAEPSKVIEHQPVTNSKPVSNEC